MLLPHIGDLPLRHVALQEVDHLALGLGLVDGRGLDPVDQAAAAVRALVPGVHRVERRVALVDREHRAFDARLPRCGSVTTTAISMMRSRVGIEAGHLEVDPDQVLVVRGQRGRSSVVRCRRCRFVTRDSRAAPTLRMHVLPPCSTLAFAAVAGRLAGRQVLAGDAPDAPRRARTATRCPRPSPARSRWPRTRRPPTTRSPRPASACSSMAFGAAVLLGWTLLGGLDALNAALRDAPLPRCGGMAYQLALLARLRRDRRPARPAVRRCTAPSARAALRLQPMTWRLWLADLVKGVAARRRRSACRSPR